MRILHTSDWHLGVTMKHLRCEAEQAAFLDWLATVITDRDVDVLIVAGDVFHHASPSNAARKLYYDFLVRCASIASLKKVVITGGNHDSPSGLDAPREVLNSLDVHVVGGLPYDRDERDHCLCPIENDDGDVELVVAAVPYVAEARLGIGHHYDEDESTLKTRFHDAYRQLYVELADQAQRQWPDIPLVATGHLTCYDDEAQRQDTDFDTELHRAGPADNSRRVGTIGAFSPGIFDERFSYVALGHIHRCFPPCKERHIWYSGTPVATKSTENTPRYVLIVDIDVDGESPRVDPVKVPRQRAIHALNGTTDELLKGLDAVESNPDFPAYLFINAELSTDEETGSALKKVEAHLEANFPIPGRPRIAEYRDHYPERADDFDAQTDEKPLEELSPMDVFLKMYQARHPDRDEPSSELVHTFHTVLDALTDED